MTHGELYIKANNPKSGMTLDEIIAAATTARESGFTIMGRTGVGFGGQIQSMRFKQPREGENPSDSD